MVLLMLYRKDLSGSKSGGPPILPLRLDCLAASALWMLAEVEATRHRLPVAQYAL